MQQQSTKSVMRLLAEIGRNVRDKQTIVCSGGPDEGWKTVFSYRHDKLYTTNGVVKTEFVYIEWDVCPVCKCGSKQPVTMFAGVYSCDDCHNMWNVDDPTHKLT